MSNSAGITMVAAIVRKVRHFSGSGSGGASRFMRKLPFGMAALFIFSTQMLEQSKAAKAARTTNGSADKAIAECRARYSCDRGHFGNQMKPMWIEACFKEKTGIWPSRVGPLYPPHFDLWKEFGCPDYY